MMMRILAVLVLCLALVPNAAHAQSAPAVRVGSLVAVWTPARPGALIGLVVRQDDSTLTITPRGERTATVLDKQTITRIDLGRRKPRGRAVLVGAAAGALTGVLVGLVAGDDEPGTFIRLTAMQKAGVVSVLTVPFGALIGFGVGGGTEWTPTRLAPQASIPPAPRLSATVRIRF